MSERKLSYLDRLTFATIVGMSLLPLLPFALRSLPV
jgi:hypothetical protein